MSSGGAGPRLAVDYTPAPGHAPGVGRYVRELVRALVRRPDAPALRLMEVGRGPTPMEGAALGLDGPGVRAAVQRRRLRLPRRVLRLGPGPGDPVGRYLFGGCRLVHRTHLELPGPRERAGQLALPHTIAVPELPPAGSADDHALRARCAAAAAVLCFSVHGAAAVAARYGLAAHRVHAVPVGADHWLRDLPDGLPLPRPTRDVLVLGAVRASRFPQETLAAFELLRASGEEARLLWVGRPGDAAGPFREALHRSPARDHVRWIEDPDEARMPACVAGARVLLHLAEDELSPVTPLEALGVGLAVVASDLPAFREALGPHGSWVEARDHCAVAEALRASLGHAGDPSARRARAAAASPYTWDTCARAHLDLWSPMLA